MKIIGASFNKISGPDATSSYKVEFVVDEINREGVLNLAANTKKGTELLLMIFETTKKDGSQNEEVSELVNETKEETKKRMFRQMHAIITDIANSKKKEPTEIKTTLKQYLIAKKYIKESSKELDVSGLAAAIFYLSSEFQESSDINDTDFE